jgi:internalin A
MNISSTSHRFPFLYQNDNELTTLPESFGSLKVGGDLRLHSNQLKTLPESFGSLTVGGDLWLHSNQLTTLPESFGTPIH